MILYDVVETKSSVYRNFGFKYDGYIYKKTICVYYYIENETKKKIPLVFMNIFIDPEFNYFGYNITNKNSELYHAYYNRDSKNVVVDIIDANVEKEIVKLNTIGILKPTSKKEEV